MSFSDQRRFDFPNDDSKDLFRAILKLDSIEECEQFFRDLCTIQELRAMTERWSIAKLISECCPYRVIAQKTGASSTTIARVSHWYMYGQGGYRLACERRFGQLAGLMPPKERVL